jgi:hypothetical protein
MSDANRTQLRFATESTWNTSPGGTFQAVRMTGESLVPEVETITSAELRADRMVSDLVQVSRQASGGFDFELSYATFDTLLQGALFDTWDTDVLENGTTEFSYAIEKAHLDIDEYFLFTGMMINEFSLTLATGSIASGSFGFLGSTTTLAQSSGAGTVTATNNNEIMNCMGNVATLTEGSYGGSLTTLSGIYVQELGLTINNNLRAVSAIGSDTIQDIAVGKMDLTGTLNAHFTSDRLFDKFLAGTAIQISFQITDGTNSYTVLIPRAKFESDSVPAPGQDQDVIETLTWRALRDSIPAILSAAA